MKYTRLNITACAVLFLAACHGKPETPLTKAAQSGDLGQIQSLLASGAPVDETGGVGLTPLIWAARQGHASAVRLLLKHGANPELRAGVNGWTPLMHAVHKGQEATALALVDGGAAVDATDGNGMTALIMAAGYGYSGIVQGLLKRGADPYSSTTDGSNALTVAVGGVPDIDRFTVTSCQAGTVEALLNQAPDLQLRNNLSGRVARLAARLGNCGEVLRKLERRAPPATSR
ncbi:MAG: ankyrin repeat domain-containing protein [Candidatus Solibacter usitatus]|nr:ankyrin repeat domain-containing protein [Candidatus Solibacter usitatus]